MAELTVYTKWDDVPDTLATKTSLSRDHGRKLAPNQQIAALKMRFNHRGRHVGYYDLYCVDEAVPKQKPTEAQLKALEKARYMAEKLVVVCTKCERVRRNQYGDAIKVTRKYWIENDYDNYVCHICKDKARAQKWAVNLFEYGDFVILDTETADLHGEIIEIAVINANGETLLNQRIKPQGEIAPGAEAVHGISLDDLADEPTFPEVYPAITEAIAGKAVIIYNEAYDTGCLDRDCKRHELEPIPFESACAMGWYAQWYGDYSEYHRDYRWQPLNGGHAALGDCLATLERLREMANDETGGQDDNA